MRLRNIKLLVWMLNVVITFGIVASVALFVLKPPAGDTGGLRDDLQAVHRDAAAERRVEKTQAKPLSHFRPTWEANIRNILPPEPVETIGDDKKEEPGAGPPLDTFVTLEMIIGDSSTLRYKQPKKDTEKKEDIKPNDTRLVLVNEKIPGIVPVAIIKEVHAFAAPPRIDVSYSGKTVSLELASEALDLSVAKDASGKPTRTVASARPFAGPAGQVAANKDRQSGPIDPNAKEGYETRPGSGYWMIPAAESERLSEDAGSILEDAEMSSYRVNGKPAGIKLDHVKEESLILQRGFQEGDIVQKINGQAINSKTELVDWVKRNHERFGMFRVELQRRGETKRLSFRVQSGGK